MAWKTERWMEEVFPGKENIYSDYRSLPTRELVVVSASVLDIALAELLSKRLIQNDKEIERFLGLNGDGRAPAASFGARIQLGYLIGILSKLDADILRTIKAMRNLFAHTVKVDFLSPPVFKLSKRLYTLWSELNSDLIKTGKTTATKKQMEEVRVYLDSTPEAGEGLLLAIFATYQAYFHLMHSEITSIKNYPLLEKNIK